MSGAMLVIRIVWKSVVKCLIIRTVIRLEWYNACN